MKLIVPAVIIGLVGGMLDAYTDLHKIWCFLIGAAAFFVFVLVQSIIKTALIRRKTRDTRKVWLNQNNNVVKTE